MSGARRYGGAFSPGANPAAMRGPAAKPWFARVSWRAVGLRLAPTPLIFAFLDGAIRGETIRLGASAGFWLALLLAAKLAGDGVRAQEAYDERLIARPPALPRKLIASALTGLSVGGICWLLAGAEPVLAGFWGLLALGAHVVCFGPDPMRAKGAAGVPPVELERAAAKLAEAERLVDETARAAAILRDRGLEERIDRLAFAARDILKELEADPRDLPRARRFLTVHLVGLRDAALQFAEARAKGAAEAQRAPFEALLADLEASFAKTRAGLLSEDETALEIEIEVLRGRLKQEGAL